MHRQLDAKQAVAPRVVSIEPPAAAALALLVASCVAFFIATSARYTLAYLGAIGVGFGLLSVGVYVVWVRGRHMSPERKANIAFETVYKHRNEPCFLSNQIGRVLAANKRLLKDAGPKIAHDAAQCLESVSEDAQAIVYRMLNRLVNHRSASEFVTMRDGCKLRVSATTCDHGFVFWVIETQDMLPKSPPSDPPAKSCPIVLVDELGKVTGSNRIAKEVLGEDLEAKNDIWESVASDQMNSGHVVEINRQRMRVYKGQHEDGVKEAILIPVDSEELIVADPEQFYNTLPVAIARISDDGTVIYANDAAVDLLGARARPGAKLGDLMEGLGRSIDERIRDMCRGRSHMRSEVARAKVRGQEAFLQVTLKRLLLNGDTTLLAVINDATELKTLEAQFVQSQKMHAVGQLAGGVAHDFNNLLTAINGHCDLVLMRHQPMDTDYGDLIQIRHNANRAASLVGQLLAFSRKQTLVPKVVDLYDTLSDINHLLNRLLGEKVTLRIEAGHGLPSVRVDERQLEQVIMNLVVNARDAMPDGGEVEIKAYEITFDEDTKRDNAVIPFGQYVQIDVSDTGVGIPGDQIAKIFEPFYTTKKVGEGTGLGLSTAYGIIKQTGGFIFAQSEIGMGTTFTVLLPANTEEEQVTPAAVPEAQEPRDLTGSGVVLLVEDEVPVRSFAARALTIRGYTVLEAASAEEALEILEDDDLHVDIFVSDVIMPGMDGPTWVKKAQEKRPDAKVVFVSGYAEDVFEGGKIKVPNSIFLPKPFSLNDLTLKVKEQMSVTLH